MSITIGKRFKKYIQTKCEVQYYLEDLLIMVDPYTIHHLTKKIFSMVANPLKWKDFFRVLILTNKLLIEGVIQSQEVSNILSSMRLVQKKHDQPENKIINELLLPYKLYLQKRSLISPTSKSPDSDIWTYQLINLINSGTSVAPSLYLIGRYFHQKVKVAPLFNVVLAQDISQLYEAVVQSVSGASEQFLKEMERMHQKMYIVFYNCYFGKQTAPFRPAWIKTYFESSRERESRARERDMRVQNLERSLSLGINPIKAEKNQVQVTTQSSPKVEQQTVLSQIQTSQFRFSCNEESFEGEDQRELQKKLDQLKLLQSMVRVLGEEE